MTCADAGRQIDGFVDGELAPGTSIDVARHLGQCRRCDATVRQLLAIRDALVVSADRAVQDLDLSGVWAQVDASIGKNVAHAAQEVWRERAAARRRVPRSVAWGSMAVAAMAAAAALFLRPVGTPQQLVKNDPPAAVRPVGEKRLPNHVLIDRLAGKDIALRREPKSGTTMIWVNHEVERNGW